MKTRKRNRNGRSRTIAGLKAIGMAMTLSFVAPMAGAQGPVATQIEAGAQMHDEWKLVVGPFELCLPLCLGYGFCCNPYEWPM